MAYVITEPCLGEQYAACVEVCPADCIYPGTHEKKSFMVIDPDTCINCDACLNVCPVNAIVPSEKDDPKYAKINADLASVFKSNPPVKPRPI